MREYKFVGGFLFLVGTGILLFSLWSAVTLSPPYLTRSLLNTAMVQAVIPVFGSMLGAVVFHSVWVIIGAVIIGLSCKVLKHSWKPHQPNYWL